MIIFQTIFDIILIDVDMVFMNFKSCFNRDRFPIKQEQG